MLDQVCPKAPLIVIDLQTDMFSGLNHPPMHEAKAVLANVKRLIAWARSAGRPVVFIRHDGPIDDTLAPGAPGWPLWPALGQAADEPTFAKSEQDSFTSPEFSAWIERQNTGHLILVGAQTDYCVGATTRTALARGMGVTVVADAHSTWSIDQEDAASIVARHNREFKIGGATVVATDDLIQVREKFS